MGVDLYLLPFDADLDAIAYSHTILNCERRRELWEAIEAADFTEAIVPKGFTTYLGNCTLKTPDGEECGESHYGETQDTPYGEPLKYVHVSDLLTLRKHQGVQDNAQNRAIWAYLAELPKDTKVALYWH